MEEAEKPAPEVSDTQNDMTQDLPELDETQQILIETQPILVPSVPVQKGPAKDTQGSDQNDDWDLRFSETQETQELVSSARIRESKGGLSSVSWFLLLVFVVNWFLNCGLFF